MSIFDSLKRYQGAWKISATKSLAEELGTYAADLKGMEVIPSEYGLSIEFDFGAYKNYIPLSNESNLEIGETPRVEDLNIITLVREGDAPISRIIEK